MKTSTYLIAFATFLAFSIVACGGHRIPEPPGDHPEGPHISWSIHAGTADNPEPLLVCESNPRSECIVGASRLDRQFFATLHLYLHPAAGETTYVGVAQVGFFAGEASAHRLDVKATIKPGEEPRRSMIYDRLPMKPGTYTMEIDLVATETSSPQKREIRDRVNVIVK
jgi:hypothetical protein